MSSDATPSFSDMFMAEYATGIEHFPAQSTVNPLDMYKLGKSKNVEKNGNNLILSHVDAGPDIPDGQVLDVYNWLPYAASQYNISKDINDYIIVPAFLVPSDLPNRNGVGFPLKELLEFSPDHGMQYYKTLKGKPTHYEHKNADHTIAKGVIFDSYLRPLQGYGGGKVAKLTALLGFDRTRDPDLCHKILTRQINAYSMGAYVGGYFCSYCNAQLGHCGHIDPKRKVDFYLLNGHLVYRRCTRPLFFETSAVGVPAYSVATNDSPVVVNGIGLS